MDPEQDTNSRRGRSRGGSRLTLEERRARNAQRQRARRARLRDEQPHLQREREAVRHRARRDAEGSELRLERQDADARRHQDARVTESEDARISRQGADALYHRELRVAEDDESRSVRQSSDARRHRDVRSLESDETRIVRQSSDARRHRDVRSEQAQRTTLPQRPAAVVDIDAFDRSTVAAHSVGSMTEVCNFCGALRWSGESKGMCCRNGAVSIVAPNPPPDEFVQMWSDRRFMAKIRAYNSVFSFTSMGATIHENVALDERYANARGGVYTFRVQGTICHRIGGLYAPEGQAPAFAQIYVHDPDMERQISRRMSIIDGLDVNCVRTIQSVLSSINPFAQQFIAAGERDQPDQDLRLAIRACPRGLDHRTHNSPTADEVAAIIIDEGATNERDIILHKRSGGLQRISDLHPAYDPLHFPLLHPFGEYGYSIDVRYQPGRVRNNNERVSPREFYAYKLFRRANEFDILHRSGRLFQQWCVEQYVKTELGRLRFIRNNQSSLRADLYRGVADALLSDADLGRVGRFVLLPPTFTGGERYMRKQYYDSMAIVREFGKPSLFITITCNPDWPEIREALQGERAEHHPDIVARVFRLKLKEIKDEIMKNGIFGRAVAYVYVIEFQKRGLPHAHMLIKLADECAPRDPSEYDKFVCAEIPDANEFPELHRVVTLMMMHGPCGVLNPRAPCMKDGKCTKGYPKRFADHTTCDGNGYPMYRRRDQGRTTMRNGHELDNRWVVPYNPYLCQRFNCHMNVEICSTVTSVKYLYKYVYKGHDRAVVTISRQPETDISDPSDPTRPGGVVDIDEIEKYLSARYISAPESCWRLFAMDLQGKSHNVIQLAVHLPQSNYVVFNPSTANSESIALLGHTHLTRFFEICTHDPEAADRLYHEMPRFYRWDSGSKRWITRKRGHEKAIGRMVAVSPVDVERYHIRLLLCFVKGPKSFEDLRTFEGVVYDTFQLAARARGLLEDDSEWHRCMQEAISFQMPRQLRRLFAIILTCCNPADPRGMWDACAEGLSEDNRRQFDADVSDHRVLYRTLCDLDRYLVGNGKSLSAFPMLPQLNEFSDIAHEATTSNSLINNERSYDMDELRQLTEDVVHLNPNQRHVFAQVMTAVLNESAENRLFFIDGPGGTGKSFVLEKILASTRQEMKIALAVATSGIAALQLMGGRTAHSTFKLPMKLDSESTCNVSARSQRCELLTEVALIVWDEAPMMNKHGFEAVDRTLRDIMQSNKPFGGKVVVLAGDFRQILPVVPRGTPADIVEACIKRSPLWRHFQTLRLTDNMRVRNEQDLSRAAEIDAFAQFLLDVGEGRSSCDSCDQGFAKIPREMMVELQEGQEPVQTLLNTVYSDISEQFRIQGYFSPKVILTPLNTYVHEINNQVLDRLPGVIAEYLSIDSIEEQEGLDMSLYPIEFLNQLTLSGMPPHKLRLKVGAPVILLRNIDGDQGLCNGTRLQVVDLRRNCLLAVILTGSREGQQVAIPRIPLVADDVGLPFKLRRRQFPLQLAFAMTINKAQGQTVHEMGLYLPSPVFSHGQLYVALSRSTSQSGIKIVAENTVHEDENGSCIENHVYPGITSE